MVATQKTIKGWIYDPLLPLDESKFHGKADIEISKRTILKNGIKGYYDSISKVIVEKAIKGKSVYCFIEGCGYFRVVSFSESDKFIYFEKTTSTPPKNHIFYSFQSDNEESTQFLEKLIQTIVDNINSQYKNLINGKDIRLERAHRPGEGATKIDEKIQKKIQESMLFIADLTPLEICKNENKPPKHLFNPNVCLELGYALFSKKPSQIVILCPSFKIPSDHRDRAELAQTKLPFDIATRKCVMDHDIDDFIKSAVSDIVSQLLVMHGHTPEDESTVVNNIVNICLSEFGKNETK